MANCPVCKSPMKEGSSFCTVCGTRIDNKIKTVVCPKCGNTLKEGAKVCTVCGAEVNTAAAAVNTEKEEPQEMLSAGIADLSVLDEQEQRGTKKYITDDGTSGEMDSISLADLKKPKPQVKKEPVEQPAAADSMAAAAQQSIPQTPQYTANPEPVIKQQNPQQTVYNSAPSAAQSTYSQPTQNIPPQNNTHIPPQGANITPGKSGFNALIPLALIFGVLLVVAVILMIKVIGG